MTSIFVDRVHSARKIAGVFESDEDVGYFYLYKLDNKPNQKIIGAIQVCSGVLDFAGEDVEIIWSADESRVGLAIKGRLWAYFDVHSRKGFAGHYPNEPLDWIFLERYPQ